MDEKQTKQTSKFLSLILRHEPERVGLMLDEAGWVGVQDLLDAVNRNGTALSFDDLRHVVATSDKKRFAFNENETRIRANQGHSVKVDLRYSPEEPPEVLYHGTATRFLEAIRQSGLEKMERHDVHLSAETTITLQVGGRHGKPALLKIRAGEMHRAGNQFRRSANGVWLTQHVPPQYIEFPTNT
jgi:putative RNA 2'-phosphotransferase